MSATGDIGPELERRRAAAAAWALDDEVVIVGAGELIPIPGRGDITYPFRAHSDYYWLTDRNRAARSPSTPVRARGATSWLR
ncbi:MAG: hypothetical protein JOZ07_08450 [Solirubrobacterales bacterium]|nr:hypothetical protein [Solirubrobacterales bacterium]